MISPMPAFLMERGVAEGLFNIGCGRDTSIRDPPKQS
jgi:hypothetical protein